MGVGYFRRDLQFQKNPFLLQSLKMHKNAPKVNVKPQKFKPPTFVYLRPCNRNLIVLMGAFRGVVG